MAVADLSSASPLRPFGDGQASDGTDKFFPASGRPSISWQAGRHWTDQSKNEKPHSGFLRWGSCDHGLEFRIAHWTELHGNIEMARVSPLTVKAADQFAEMNVGVELNQLVIQRSSEIWWRRGWDSNPR